MKRRRLLGGRARRRDLALLAGAALVWVAGWVVAPARFRVPLLYTGLVGWGVLGLWAVVLNVPRWSRRRRRPAGHHRIEQMRHGEWWERRR